MTRQNPRTLQIDKTDTQVLYIDTVQVGNYSSIVYGDPVCPNFQGLIGIRRLEGSGREKKGVAVKA